MALIKLKTNLKSLKFGSDVPGGGDSGLPYIKTEIPNTLKHVTLDFPIRGGALAVINSIEDTKRIGKFLLDLPKGPIFILKQVALHFSNPKLDAPSSSSPALNLLNKISSQPTRVSNLGVNILAQIPVTAFGVHLTKHGINLVARDEDKYEYIVGKKNLESPNENRLVSLKNRLFPINNIIPPPPADNFLGKIKNIINIGKDIVNSVTGISSDTISEYRGGPDSLYGIGKTRIKRYSYTDHSDEIRQSIVSPFLNKSHFNSLSFDYDLIRQQYGPTTPTSGENFVDFRKTINEAFKRPTNSIIPEGSDYKKNNIETRIGVGNPGKKSRNRSKVSMIDLSTQDKVNMLPLTDKDFKDFKNIFPSATDRDIIKFRFEAINNNQISSLNTVKIVFRAFLSGITDSFGGEWNSFNYAGRGEKFHTYQSFNRDISFNFKIAAQSRAEMKPLYQKLNFLVSNTAPDYTDNGFMRGSFMLLTIGNWIYRQPGILKSINLTIDDNTPWEIAMTEPENGEDSDMNELPHVINASVNFTPIHSFIPRKGYESPVKFIHTGTGNVEGRWLDRKDTSTGAKGVLNVSQTSSPTGTAISSALGNLGLRLPTVDLTSLRNRFG